MVSNIFDKKKESETSVNEQLAKELHESVKKKGLRKI